ncbi:MAG: hypothetical protein ACN2B6_00400 [Rickettsiales bacterium]
MNILYLLPVATQPRYLKRVECLAHAGANSHICYFKRDYFIGKDLPEGSVCLGKIEHGRYIKRFLTLIISACTLMKHRSNGDVVYCFGLDMLFFAFIIGLFLNKKIIYEVSDVQGLVLSRTILSRIARAIEKFLLMRVDILVATSPNYIEGYYHDILNINIMRSVVIENKLNKAQFSWIKTRNEPRATRT